MTAKKSYKSYMTSYDYKVKFFCSYRMAAMIHFFWYQLFRLKYIKIISVKFDILYGPCMTTRKS